MGRITIKRIPQLGRIVWNRFRISTAQKLTAMLFLMLLAAGANIVFFKSLIHDFRDMAGTVNMAGKLRLLSQKIELDTVHFVADSKVNTAAVINGVVEFDAVLEALTDGGTVFGITVQRVHDRHHAALEDVRTKWHAYRDEIRLVLHDEDVAAVSGSASALNALRNQLSLRSTPLLHASEHMVNAIVKDMQQRQRLATTHMYIAFVVVALSFLLTLWFVRRRIARPLSLLYDGVRQLEDGNYHVRLRHPVADDMGRLMAAFNSSAQHFDSLLHELEFSHDSLKRAEMMFRGVVENSGISVYVRSGPRFLFANQEFATVLGYERETLLAELETRDVFIDDNPKAVIGLSTQQLMEDHHKTGILRRVRCHDGSTAELEVFKSVMQLDGEPVCLCVALDVTKRRQDEASARLARLVYDVTSEGMVITGADANIIHVNPAFTKITGYEANEVLGKKMSLLSSGRHDREFYEAMWSSIERTGTWVGEIWNRRKSGEEFAERLRINTSYDEDGKVQYRVGLFSDITTRKKTDAIIWKQANFDFLTGLPNRKLLRDKLTQALSHAEKSGTNVAFALLDVDHFKDINDSLGHHGGDELLKQAAVRIQACLRAGDAVGRLGGDEFMIVISDIEDKGVANRVCERIVKALTKPFFIQDSVVHVTASLGLTLFPHDGESTGQMFKNADMAMYEAKSRGRNQYSWFHVSMQEKIVQRQRLTRELADAVERKQFSLVYQPIIDLNTGTVCKAEALIRWNHPTRGLIGPVEFIPFAEDSGVIHAIGDWVFETAAKQAAEWRTAYGGDFQISINVSPVQFLSDVSGLSRWFEKLDDWQLQGESLVMEITEGLLMDACGTVTQRLHAFQEGGIQVALDDFGTGYSSLSYLKKFDIDYIKIDRTFVSNLGPDTDDRALCEAIVVMAHRLGLKVVAEGIETEEQHQLLMQAGCDYGQGYLFGKPLDSKQFGQLLAQRYPIYSV